MYLELVISKKLNLKNLFFGFIMKATEEKSRIQIRNPVVLIRGSESVSKCHRSETLGEMNCGKQYRNELLQLAPELARNSSVCRQTFFFKITYSQMKLSRNRKTKNINGNRQKKIKIIQNKKRHAYL
jgi:hypothetical protein